MRQLFRISSYRLAFWHAPQRARHEEGDIFTCIFCQYSEGIARIKDVVDHLRQQGFLIPTYDSRSFNLEAISPEEIPGNRLPTVITRLSTYVSGLSRVTAI